MKFLNLQKHLLKIQQHSIQEDYLKNLIHKDLEDRNLLLDKSLKLEKIMNEKMPKKDINNRASERRNRKNTRKRTINKISYFLANSLNKSLNQKWKLRTSPRNRKRKIRELLHEK